MNGKGLHQLSSSPKVVAVFFKFDKQASGLRHPVPQAQKSMMSMRPHQGQGQIHRQGQTQPITQGIQGKQRRLGKSRPAPTNIPRIVEARHRTVHSTPKSIESPPLVNPREM